MKKLLTYLVIIFITFAGMASAEWIGCDIPDVSDGVVESIVVVDDQPEVTVPDRINQAGDAVLLLDIEKIGTATVVVYFVNNQGRRSPASVPFVLKARPSASAGHRIVRE